MVQKNAFLSLWRPALLQKSQLGTKKFLFSGSNQKVLSGRINNNIKSNLKKQLLLCKNSIFWNFHKFLKRYNFLILNNLVVSLPNMYLSYLKMIVRAQGMWRNTFFFYVVSKFKSYSHLKSTVFSFISGISTQNAEKTLWNRASKTSSFSFLGLFPYRIIMTQEGFRNQPTLLHGKNHPNLHKMA